MQPQKQTMPTDIADHRRQLREDFIASLGWKNITLEALPADASFRRYYRLAGAAKPMLLMQDPPDRPPVPPFVMVEPFIKIADHMRALGLHSPEIYAKDIPNGLLVIEDFGDDTYTRLLNRNVEQKPLYEMAVDVLTHLHKHPKRGDIALPKYDDKLLVDEAMLLPDWYYPALTGKTPTEAMKDSYRDVWKGLFAKFPKDQETMVLRDYHVDNLMLTRGEGIGRCGLLDFQDAVIGQFSYDLMSLLEDARRDVPKELQKHLYDRYMAAMGGAVDRKGFDYAYRVLAAQRHAKVLGIFVRLFVRDKKERYLQFIPHVHKLFMNALNDPSLAPLQDWFESNGIDIAAPLKIAQK
ncbi:MAG: aminoglycoside phosphotransferase [Alphaproteobacteria bacterium]|nr:MAG: aminoglycoside phosphotransferase [Alphaproteobacteria bacterium]